MKTELFLIALVPPLPLREQVRSLKLEMLQLYGAGHALKAPAHITLEGPFRLAPDTANKLEDTLDEFSGQQRPITVQLRDFDHFSIRVIFIRILEHGPVIALERQLTSVLSGSQLLQKRPKPIPFHPHMTIATRDLEEAAFFKAWADFKNRAFHAFFEVNSLHLLRHNGKNWDIFREFRFGR